MKNEQISAAYTDFRIDNRVDCCILQFLRNLFYIKFYSAEDAGFPSVGSFRGKAHSI